MKRCRRVVIKVGTKVITSHERLLDADMVSNIASQIADVMDSGVEVVLVTSGAIGAGLAVLGMKRRPGLLNELQAVAAVGQSHLMHVYGTAFRKSGYNAGQILLTQDDFNDRRRYLNIKHTIDRLISHNAVPVINENDTVATEEIRCGDNDRISSLVADLCRADKLLILTDVDGLLDESGNVISVVLDVTQKIAKLAGGSRCDLGTGGMASKIAAARTATSAGIECVIANGRANDCILRVLLKGEALGTAFIARKGSIAARKRWIAFSSKPRGVIKIDEGAALALGKNDSSLLASGVTAIEGAFSKGDVVSVADAGGRETARGVTNYSSRDLLKIKGLKSGFFKSVLGYEGPDEIIHKDNLVVI